MSGEFVHVVAWRTLEEATNTALGWRARPHSECMERRDHLDRVVAEAWPCVSGGFAWRTCSHGPDGHGPDGPRPHRWRPNNIQTGCATLEEAKAKADARLLRRRYELSDGGACEPTAIEKRDEARDAERARITRTLVPGIAERVRAAFEPLADLLGPDDVTVALLTNALVEGAAARAADEMIATLRDAEAGHPMLVDNVVRFAPRR